MSAIQNAINSSATAQKAVRSLWSSLALIALFVLGSFGFGGTAGAANLITTNTMGQATNSWVSTTYYAIFKTNLTDATNFAVVPVAGNTYATFDTGIPLTFNLANTPRIRPPNVDGTNTFPGDSLTMNTNTEIRFKKGAATGTTPFVTPTISDFPGVGGNPGLILNGGMLEAGDDAVFPISGSMKIATDSILGFSDGGINQATLQPLRGLQIRASMSGTGSVIILAGVTNFAQAEITSTNNTNFTGRWIVKAGSLKGTSPGSLGKGSITLDTAYSPSTALMTAAAIAQLSNGPIRFEANYDINTVASLTCNGDAKIVLHQNLNFGAVTLSGTSLAAGTYTYANLVSAGYQTNLVLGGSGTITVGPAPAPTGLTGTPGDSQAFLTWTGLSPVYSYVVYRDDGNGAVPIVTNAPGVTNFLDSGLFNDFITYLYTVSAINASGEGAQSAGAAVTPTPTLAPVFSTDVVPGITNCSGVTVSFSVAVTNTYPVYFFWYYNTNNLIVGETNTTLTIPNAQSSTSGVYSVVVTNANTSGTLSVTSSFANLLIRQTTIIDIPPANLTNCPGTLAGFTVFAHGDGPLTYTWRKGAVVVQDPNVLNSSSFSINAVAPTDAGTYSVTVAAASGNCNTVSNSFTLSVIGPPTITGQPQSGTTPTGNGIVFAVTNTSIGPASYQWISNGVFVADSANITGSTTATLAISNITAAFSGTGFKVAISNCAGLSTSLVAVVTVVPISGITFDFNTPGQFTNAPYNIGANNWLNSVTPQGNIVPTAWEAASGGVTNVGAGTTSGAIDFINNEATDETSTCLAETFDFSLPGKTLIASTMFKVKLPNAFSANRAVQIGFCTTTNQGGLNYGTNNLWSGLNGNNGMGYMTAILQSTVSNSTTTISYQLDAQSKVSPGTTAITVTPINTTSNALTVGNWYKMWVRFINTATAGVGSSNFTVEAYVQDMGPTGVTPGNTNLVLTPQTMNAQDVVNSRSLLLAIRSFEQTGMDLFDNVYVQTVTGPAAFVLPPASQTVLQGRPAKFNAYVDGDGPYTYQWKSNNVAIAGAGAWNYTTPALGTNANGASYTCSVTTSNLPGQVPVTITSAAAIVTVTPDTLKVESVGSVDGYLIGLRFNQPVDPVTAQNATNYTIGGSPCFLAVLRPDLRSVLLTPSPAVVGAFTVTVANVKNVDGVAISSPNNAATGFVAGFLGVSINSAVPAGSHISFASNSFELVGGGGDLFSAPDGFRYMYRVQSGDFDAVVRIPKSDIIQAANKAGFELRSGLDPSGLQVYAGVCPPLPARNQYEGTTRAVWNGAGISWGNTTTMTPTNNWLRMRKVGFTYKRYSSTNGINWLFDGETSLNLPDPYLFGLCAVANNGNNANMPFNVMFDNFGNGPTYAGAGINIVANPPASSTPLLIGLSTNITMTATLTNSAGNLPVGELAFLWQRTNSATGGWTNMPTAGSTNNSVNTGILYDSDNGTLYRAILSAPGALSVTSLVAQVNIQDAANPTVSSATTIGAVSPFQSVFQISVTFSEPVSLLTATNVANYTVTNSAGVSLGVASVNFLNGDTRTVVINTINPIINGNYSVVINNVTDTSGIPVPANTVKTFTQIAGVPGSPTMPIVQEWYLFLTNATAVYLNDLLYDRFSRYGGTGTTNPIPVAIPDYITYSNLFGVNCLGGFASSLDNYAVKTYTYFVPTNTGQYKFFVRCDDSAEFFMNTNSVGSTNPPDWVCVVSNLVGQTTFQPWTNYSGYNQNGYYGMDTRIDTKFLAGGTNCGMIVKPSAGSMVIGGIRFVTANDTVDRDPSRFTLEGCNAADPRFGPWTLIASGETGLTGTNNGIFTAGVPPGATNRLTQIPDIMFTNSAGLPLNTTAYSSYRILFPTLRGTNNNGVTVNGSLIQMAEVQLLGTNNAASSNALNHVRLVPSGAIPEIYIAANNANFAQGNNSFTNTLTAGQPYYMEVRFKESGGGDGMGLAIRTGSDTNIPSQFEVIPAALCAYPADLAPRVPVVFERYSVAGPGNTITSGGAGNPGTANTTLTNLTGAAILDLTNAFLQFNVTNHFPDALGYMPTLGWWTNFVGRNVFPGDNGNSTFDNYATRMMTYFVPPSNGLYRFYGRSDDSCQLLMNTNAVNSSDPAGVVSLGLNNGFVGSGAYQAFAQNVPLFATNFYYLEVRHKEGGGGDGVAITFRASADAGVPGNGEFAPVSSFRFPTNAFPVRSASLRFLTTLTPQNPTVTDGSSIVFQAPYVDGYGPFSYTWYKNGVVVFTNGTVANAFGQTFTTQPLQPLDNGAVFTVVVTNQFGAISQSSTITVNPDSVAPVLTYWAGSQYNNQISLIFTEASGLDSVSAGFIPNYQLSLAAVPQPVGAVAATVTSATLSSDKTRLLLKTTPLTANAHYKLQVGGVKDASFEANQMVTTNVTISGWSFGGAGVLVEMFTNLNTGVSSIADLQGQIKYLFNDIDTNGYGSDGFGFGTSGTVLNTPWLNPPGGNGVEGYGARVSALFVCPSNGIYRFFQSSDDSSQMFMNTNNATSEDPNGRKLMLSVSGANLTYTNLAGTATTNAVCSAPVTLVGGKRYYMESIVREGTGGDYVHATFAIMANDATNIPGLLLNSNDNSVPFGIGWPTVSDSAHQIPATTTIGGTNFVMLVPPGNPDQFAIVGTPPAVTNLFENTQLQLAVAVIPLGFKPTIQWQRTNYSGGFTDIVGATSIGYTQIVVLGDDQTMFKANVSMPGVAAASFVTLVGVLHDTVLPVLLSASSVDGTNIQVQFSEAIQYGDPDQFGVVHPAGDVQYYHIYDQNHVAGDNDLIASSIHFYPDANGVSNRAIVTIFTDPSQNNGHAYTLQGSFTLALDYFDDFAADPNLTSDALGNGYGNMSGNALDSNTGIAVGQVLGLSDLVLGVQGTAGAGTFNFNAPGYKPYPQNPWSTNVLGVDITTSGYDLWNNVDGGDFIYRPILGNFDMRVRVEGIIPADQWTKACIMARVAINNNTLNPDRDVYISATPTNTPIAGQLPLGAFYYQSRGNTVNFTNQTSTIVTNSLGSNQACMFPNAWLRLQRLGNVFHTFVSSNNVDWVPGGDDDTSAGVNGDQFGNKFAFPQIMYLGLATCAHDQTAGDAESRLGTVKYRDMYLPSVVPTITSQPTPSSQTLTVGATISYSVAANNPANSGPLTYQWLFNGTVITGATNSAFTSAPLHEANSGIYSVIVANDGGGVASVPLTVVLTNATTVAVTDNTNTVQGTILTIAPADLMANDIDPEGLPLALLGVSGNNPMLRITNFNQGPLIGATNYGSASNNPTAGVNGTGCLELTAGAGNLSGAMVLDEMNPGKQVVSFTANFKMRISDGSAEVADGFSFNLANDLPDAATGSRSAEQGIGSGLSLCYKAYRPPLSTLTIGANASTITNWTANLGVSAFIINYSNKIVKFVQTPTWNSTNYFPVSISMTEAGTVSVSVNGTNVFTNVPLPNFTPTRGRFGIFARTGGSFESHRVEDLVIYRNAELTAAGNFVQLSGGNIIYSATNCGPDTFYYVINDGDFDGYAVGQVNVAVATTNVIAAPIVTCPANRNIPVGINCLATLPDLTGLLGVVDNCSGVIVTQDPAIGTAVGAVGVTTVVTLTASNYYSLTASCQFTVTNADLTAPILGSCPVDFTNECGSHTTFTLPTATDNCDLSPVVTCVPASGSVFPKGTNLVSCTARDVTGNVSAACTFHVTIVDTTAPVITCAPVNVNSCVAAVATFTPSVSDACDPSPTAAVCVPPSGSTFPLGPTSVTCTNHDASGNIGTCTFTVTVSDTSPPVVTCPSNVTTPCATATGTVVNYAAATALDNCAGDVSGTVNCTPASGSTFPGGTTIVTCTAHDPNNNVGQCTFTVTVTTSAASLSTLTPSVATTNGAGFTLVVSGSGFLCGQTVLWNGSPRVTSIDSGVQLSATIPASDLVVTQDITTVVITTTNSQGQVSNPLIFTIGSTNVAGAQSAQIGQGSSVTVASPNISNPVTNGETAVTATVNNDASGGAVTVTTVNYNQNPSGAGTLNGGSGYTDLKIVGADAGDSATASFYYPASVTGQAETDLRLQYFTGTIWQPVLSSGGVAPDKNTTDNLDGTSSGGRFTVTFDNTSTPKITELTGTPFTIVPPDTTPPVITCSGNVSANAGAGLCSAVVNFTVTATDNAGTATLVCTPASGSTFNVGPTPVNCVATDGSGNTANNCNFTVTVHDVDAPTVTCPSDMVVECAGPTGATASYTTPTGHDTCDANPTVVCSPVSGSTFPSGQSTVTCTATDASGNQGQCTFHVTVQDTTAPTITCAADKAVECGTAWTFNPPTHSDICDGAAGTVNTISTVTNAGVCANSYSVTRTWTVTDSHANTSLPCSQTVTVADTTAPTITCSGNVTNNCTSTNGAVVNFTVTATDTCDASPTVTCNPTNGATFAQGVTTVNCTATDACNNTSGSCSFTVTVKDATPATLTIVRTGSTVVISWPQSCTPFALKSASTLGGSFGPSGLTPVAVGSNYYATNTAAGSGKNFYRLEH